MPEFKCPPDCWAACCFNCDVIPELKDWDVGDGRCKHLDDNGKCMIYETRPDLCSVEKMHTQRYSDMDWDFYCWLTAKTCGQFRKYLAHKKPVDKKKKR